MNGEPKQRINSNFTYINQLKLKQMTTTQTTAEKKSAIRYYKAQLERVKISPIYAPTIKIFAGAGGDTNHLSINEESAKVLINWLTKNFLK